MRNDIELVKLRRVGDSVVVSIPQTVLSASGLKVGDKVRIGGHYNGRVYLLKESK